MKLALMQPYLFPYLGYYQLVAAVDEFVLYDDAQYIKGGWINRNRMLLNGRDMMFTVGVRHDSHLKQIRERQWADHRADTEALLRKLAAAYGRAPHYSDVQPVIADALAFANDNVADGLAHSVRVLCGHLGLDVPIRLSSEIQVDPLLMGQDRVLAVCEQMKATTYINSSGGRELYDREAFSGRGISLLFIQPELRSYPQWGGEFVPGLSIIDVLMFNPIDRVRELLGAYTLS